MRWNTGQCIPLNAHRRGNGAVRRAARPGPGADHAVAAQVHLDLQHPDVPALHPEPVRALRRLAAGLRVHGARLSLRAGLRAGHRAGLLLRRAAAHPGLPHPALRAGGRRDRPPAWPRAHRLFLEVFRGERPRERTLAAGAGPLRGSAARQGRGAPQGGDLRRPVRAHQRGVQPGAHPGRGAGRRRGRGHPVQRLPAHRGGELLPQRPAGRPPAGVAAHAAAARGGGGRGAALRPGLRPLGLPALLLPQPAPAGGPGALQSCGWRPAGSRTTTC